LLVVQEGKPSKKGSAKAKTKAKAKAKAKAKSKAKPAVATAAAESKKVKDDDETGTHPSPFVPLILSESLLIGGVCLLSATDAADDASEAAAEATEQEVKLSLLGLQLDADEPCFAVRLRRAARRRLLRMRPLRPALLR
jgi:hypothetical protein